MLFFLLRWQIDVSNYEQVLQLRDDIERDVGFVDILVNNAGLLTLVSLREGQPEDLQRIINVNLLAQFWVCYVEEKLGASVTVIIERVSTFRPPACLSME